MKFFHAVILFVLVSFGSFGQQTILDIIDPTKTSNNLLARSNGAIADPYLFKQFMNAELYLKAKENTPMSVLINIDTYEQEVVTSLNSKEQVIDKRLIKYIKFKISEDSIALFEPINNSILLSIYRNQNNNTGLYKRFRKNLIKGVAGNGYSESTKDRLAEVEDYWLTKENVNIVFNNAKELVKRINEKWPEKSLNTDYKKMGVKSELAKLVFLINQL
jgi:hypothetical protein